MTTFSIKAQNLLLITWGKKHLKFSEHDKRAFKKQLALIAKGGMVR